MAKGGNIHDIRSKYCQQSSNQNCICPVKTPISNGNIEKFFNQIGYFDELFISTCKCFDSSIDRKLCKCHVKIPLCEFPFYADQKTERLQVIGGVDMEITEQLHDRTNRILAQQRRAHPENENQKKCCLDFKIRDVIDPID